ncbi:MAG: hypothetical protein ACQBVK_05025 [Candidatus Phytoplasma sp. TWB_XP]
MKKQFGFMTNHYKEHKNIFLNVFLFIVGFLVSDVCGVNLYVAALQNEPKYFAQTTVKKV